NPEQALGELEQMRARYTGLRIQAERLRAVSTGQTPNWEVAGTAYPGIIADQKALYEGQIENAKSRRNVLQTQIVQKKTELETFTEQESTLRKTLRILEEQLKVRETLFNKGLATRLVYLDIQKEVNVARGNLSKLLSDKQRAAESLTEVRSRL